MQLTDSLFKDCLFNEQSQCGEDGLLEKVFQILGISKGWCVELGAWDGKKYSNTYRLIHRFAWSAVLIEGDRRRFLDLLKTYQNNRSVHCVQQFVHFDPPYDLDSILKQYPIPKDFDLLSIDIDGNDFHLWDSLKDYQPKVVIIEYNPSIPNDIRFVQPRNMKINQGNSLKAIIELAKEKGYELIATTELNGVFVKKSLFPLFNIEDNSINHLRPKSKAESALFQLYDGTLVLEGNKTLWWSGAKIRQKRLQVFPGFLRFYSTSNPLKKVLRNLWRRFF